MLTVMRSLNLDLNQVTSKVSNEVIWLIISKRFGNRIPEFHQLRGYPYLSRLPCLNHL